MDVPLNHLSLSKGLPSMVEQANSISRYAASNTADSILQHTYTLAIKLSFTVLLLSVDLFEKSTYIACLLTRYYGRPIPPQSPAKLAFLFLLQDAPSLQNSESVRVSDATSIICRVPYLKLPAATTDLQNRTGAGTAA